MRTPPHRTSRAFEAGRSLRLMTTDLDELAKACLHWDVDIMQTRPGPASSALLLAQGERVQLGYTLFSGAFRSRGTIPEGCAALVIADGRTPLISYGRPLEPLDVEIMTEADGSDVSILGKSNALVIAVRQDFFDATTCALLGERFLGKRSRYRLRMTSAQTKYHVRRRLHSNLRAAIRWPSILRNPDTREMWEYSVLRDVLDASSLDRPLPSLPNRSRLASRAEDYMRSNAFIPISVADLAGAVGASERALHLGFLERFGLTPAAYLKAARLHGARRDLRNANSEIKVTEVALRWGFFHLGRFAIDYRAFFGEAPSATLARSISAPPAHAEFEAALA